MFKFSSEFTIKMAENTRKEEFKPDKSFAHKSWRLEKAYKALYIGFHDSDETSHCAETKLGFINQLFGFD